MTMDSWKLTAEHEQCLRDQAVTDDQPGPVLHDFGVVLESLGTDGVAAAGKYNLLPIEHIGELDRRLSRPLRLESKLKGPWVDHIKIGELPLEPGESMQFRYDFGDNWRFDVKLDRIEPPGAKPKAPKILERHGDSSEQHEGGGW
jgi:hypothetical protein